MAMRVRLLLVACVVIVACAVVAVAYVATRHDPVPTATPATPAADQVAQTPTDAPPPIEPVKTRSPRTPRKSTDPATPPGPAANPDPGEAPEQTPQTEAEKKAREEMEEGMKKLREQVIREFKLTPEQAAAAEPALASLETLARSAMTMVLEARVQYMKLAQQAKEDAWTPEQTRQMSDQAKREFVAAHQGELLQLLDDAGQAMEDLRPHLTPEQMPNLDHKLGDLRKTKEKLLKGELGGF